MRDYTFRNYTFRGGGGGGGGGSGTKCRTSRRLSVVLDIFH